MTGVSDVGRLDLPEFDHLDPELRGARWHSAAEGLAERGWLARSPLAIVVLDREASEEILRSKATIFPGRRLADMLGIDSGPLREEIDTNLINLNGPDHSRLRALVAPALNPRAAERHAASLRELFGEILDSAIAKRRVEAVTEICKPYASRAIARLLGADERDADQLHDWSLWVQRQFDPVALSHAGTRSTVERKVVELRAWLRALVEDKRREPAEDLASELLRAEDEGDSLSPYEVENLLLNVLIGGVDTTQSQLAHAMRLLAERPDQWSLLRSSPTELAPAAVEEALRFEPVTPFTARMAIEDLTVRDIRFPAGTLLLVCSFVGNRDPKAFAPDPQEFDLAAQAERSGRILTFGAGPHYCLGANLARVELRVALEVLAERLESLALLDEPAYGTVSGIYSLDRAEMDLYAAAGQGRRA